MNIQREKSTITIIRIAQAPNACYVKLSRLQWFNAAYAVDITGVVKCFDSLADALNYILENIPFTENERDALINSFI